MNYEYAIPRAEFPNPQFERKNWQNLNGKWQFKFDHGVSGLEQDYVNKDVFDREITVPFTYECSLSGINIKDFCTCVWYKRTFSINTSEWNISNGKVLLHFGAVDYHAMVWVNGQYAGFHKGGMTHFAFDVTKFSVDGENTVVVRAFDDQRSGKQPIGKQSNKYHSHGCCYTRTTGIWQTVWLEYVPFRSYIKSFKIYTDTANSTVTVNVSLADYVRNSAFSLQVFYGGVSIESKTLGVSSNNISVQFQISEGDLHLWDIGKGNLYDLIMTYGTDFVNRDTVYSYFGMRSICIENEKILLNGKSVFQRLVLDQGFYPEGTFTAPTGDELQKDIMLSMAAGFNGARLHQKIFEPLFHYYADKLGYITWGEHGNWGMDYSGESYQNFMCEWLEALERDFNHPSIIGWCPHNETHMGQRHDDLAYIYRATKAFDYTRPVIDTSGYVHVQTDIFDVHDYDQNVDTFKERYDAMRKTGEDKKIFQNRNIIKDKEIEDMPYFVSEFGGAKWNARDTSSAERNQNWGYGQAPEDIESFYARFEGLISALLDNPRICAFCYTQLTDVEQEQNGIFYYDREKKFDLNRLSKILGRKAAIED